MFQRNKINRKTAVCTFFLIFVQSLKPEKLTFYLKWRLNDSTYWEPGSFWASVLRPKSQVFNHNHSRSFHKPETWAYRTPIWLLEIQRQTHMPSVPWKPCLPESIRIRTGFASISVKKETKLSANSPDRFLITKKAIIWPSMIKRLS